MKEALKLALEALHYCEALNRPVHEQKIHAIKAIKEALAQPEMRPDEISTDELIYMNGLHDGMKQERALWELSKLGQEIEAQPEERNFCPRCGKRNADLTTVHTCTPPKDAR